MDIRPPQGSALLFLARWRRHSDFLGQHFTERVRNKIPGQRYDRIKDNA